jgi:hypothetical protein
VGAGLVGVAQSTFLWIVVVALLAAAGRSCCGGCGRGIPRGAFLWSEGLAWAPSR